MALICPKCEKINKCDCKSCNPDGKATDLVIILEQEQLYQCCFCSHKFNEQDSLDLEWDRMHEDFKNNITPKCVLLGSHLFWQKKEKNMLVDMDMVIMDLNQLFSNILELDMISLDMKV